MGGGGEVETEVNLISIIGFTTAHSSHRLKNSPAADWKLCHLRPVNCQLLLGAANDNENSFCFSSFHLQI